MGEFHIPTGGGGRVFVLLGHRSSELLGAALWVSFTYLEAGVGKLSTLLTDFRVSIFE